MADLYDARCSGAFPRRDLMKNFKILWLMACCCLATIAAADETDWEANVPVADIRADFDALYRGLQSAHANLYAHRSKAAYDAYFDKMLASFERDLSRFEVQLAFQRFTAYGNVAHARIEFPGAVFDAYRDAGGRTFPIYPRIVDGVAYVGEDYSGDPRIEPGDEIITLDGEPIALWLARAEAYISADTPYIAHSIMEFTFPRDLWALVGARDAFTLTLQRDGEPFTVTVPATTRAAQREAAAATPARFQLDGAKRRYEMLDETLAYLRPGPFYNAENPAAPWDNAAFKAFIDEAFHEFLDAKAQTLIIDLRQNPGGDNSFSDPMLAWIADEPFRFCSEFLIRSSDEAAASNAARLAGQPSDTESVSALFAREYARVPRGDVFSFDIPYAKPRAGVRFTGKVIALVNRHSYSNAVNVAAMIQDYELGVVAGEKTTDMATTYGAMEQFTLPATDIAVGFPKAHIIRPSGSERVDGVTPDLLVASPIVAGEDDVVLRQLVQMLAVE